MAETAVKWTSDFESFPAGRHFGSVTCFALRRLKANVEALLSIQHTFAENATPECTHIPGMCTVCGLTYDPPTEIYDVNGSLWFDYKNGALYRDYGGGVGLGSDAIGGVDHTTFSHRGDTSPQAHTIYIPSLGSTEVENLTTQEIENLSVTVTDYQDDEDVDIGGMIMPQGLHMTTPADHIGVITDDAGISYGYDKINAVQTTVYDSVSSQPIDTYVAFFLGRGALMPIFHADTTSNTVITLHSLTDSSPPDDWIAGITIRWRTAGRVKLLGRNIV
jgi:hypothetical protein